MKCSEFEFGKGEYAVIATYTIHDDAAESDNSTTIRTHERGRPKLYLDAATLALAAEKLFKIGDLKVQLRKINFTGNDDGQFVKVTLETPDGTKVLPPRVNRKEYIEPGKDKDPEHPKNASLAAVDLVENRISEYLNGDREQPELPPVKEPEARPKQGGLFAQAAGAVRGAVRGRKKAPAKVEA